jgi:hypothetical protein
MMGWMAQKRHLSARMVVGETYHRECTPSAIAHFECVAAGSPVSADWRSNGDLVKRIAEDGKSGPSGANLTLGTCPFLRHARESGHPGATDTAPEALGPRLRGGDEEEKIGVICLVRTTSLAPSCEVPRDADTV